MRRLRATRPGTGACTLASAMELWQWTLNICRRRPIPTGNKLYHGQRQGVTFALADALCWLLASRCQILDVLELEARGADDAVAAEGLAGTVQFLSDLCHTQAARAAARFRASARELVFGYNRHPAWDDEGLRALLYRRANWKNWKRRCRASSAIAVDVMGADGSHPQKAGPCAGCAGRASSSGCRTSWPPA